MKEKPPPLQILYFFSSVPFCPDDFLKNWSPPSIYFFWNLHSSLQKRMGVRNNMYSTKNLWILFVSFCVFLLEHFDVFECFYYSFSCMIWYFVKIFLHFYEQIKHKVGNRFYPPITKITKPWKLFKPNKVKGLLNFWEVKVFGWFTHIGCKRTQLKISWFWLSFILHTI